MQGISLLAEDLEASQDGLCSIELVSYSKGFSRTGLDVPLGFQETEGP